MTYKHGRSTVNEANLLKVKQFSDAEATVIDFCERLHNGNEATKDALGHTERSSHKENMIPMDTLGALVVESDKFGVFQIGTGFDDSLRKWIWENCSDVWGKLVKFKFQEVGTVDKPRFPVFIGFRDSGDLG